MKKNGKTTKPVKNETWDPKRPFDVRWDGVAWSVFRGREKQYQFGETDRDKHDAEIAKRLMNTAYHDGRRVPEGSPVHAADAEVRRLRKALRAVHGVIETRAPRDATWRPFLLSQIDAALVGRARRRK